jgi:hypothetical protein
MATSLRSKTPEVPGHPHRLPRPAPDPPVATEQILVDKWAAPFRQTASVARDPCCRRPTDYIGPDGARGATDPAVEGRHM